MITVMTKDALYKVDNIYDAAINLIKLSKQQVKHI